MALHGAIFIYKLMVWNTVYDLKIILLNYDQRLHSDTFCKIITTKIKTEYATLGITNTVKIRFI